MLPELLRTTFDVLLLLPVVLRLVTEPVEVLTLRLAEVAEVAEVAVAVAFAAALTGLADVGMLRLVAVVVLVTDAVVPSSVGRLMANLSASAVFSLL